MQRALLSCLFVLSLAISSCNLVNGERVTGDGNVIRQNRTISGFTSIDVSSAINLVITQDSAYEVTVETDSNLQSLIEIYKDGTILYIRQRSNTSIESSKDTKVYVTAPIYKELMASGACTIRSTSRMKSDAPFYIVLSGASQAELDMRAPSTKIELSGASSLQLKGETKDLELDGDGASTLHSFDFLSENADVELSGSSHAELYASVKLEVNTSGASQVKYKGAANFVAHTSGASGAEKIQ